MEEDLTLDPEAAEFLQMLTLHTPCAAAAPLVVNGMPYVGCQLDKGHDGPHKVEITWAR